MVTTNPFDRGAAEAMEYDAWYDSADGREVLGGEVAALAQLFRDITRPWLEIGTGTGRFGAAFDVDVGLDPAAAMLSVASTRLPCVIRGAAEALPIRSSTIGGVLSVATFEFLDSPAEAMQEVARVLKSDGAFVLGILPAAGPWARKYAAQGHDLRSPFHHARFYAPDEVAAFAGRTGLRLEGVPGYGSGEASTEAQSGFLAMRFSGEAV